ncbi:MAG: RidA family protein [Deltaproteobacteria bacterium]|nr:RidA family protein [Deltaproteobacteria bacterium]
MQARRHARSGSPYEDLFGFSRAVRVGDLVHVAGTAPIEPGGGCAETAADQARRAFGIGLAALGELGGAAADVVRTRMYITDPADADAIGAVHGELFREARPAATMVVVAGLLDPRWKVEIELEAVLDGPR